KSRLKLEFIRRLSASSEALTLLVGHARSVSAGASFGLATTVIQSWAGIAQSDPTATRRDKLTRAVENVGLKATESRHMLAYLGELVGASFAEEFEATLASATLDPSVRGQHIRSAFIGLLTAMTSVGPVLIDLEDIHWGDTP